MIKIEDITEEQKDFLFNFLELRHCENCGMVESYDNGGGTIDEMVCCGECYNETADRLEEDNEDEED